MNKKKMPMAGKGLSTDGILPSYRKSPLNTNIDGISSFSAKNSNVPRMASKPSNQPAKKQSLINTTLPNDLYGARAIRSSNKGTTNKNKWSRKKKIVSSLLVSAILILGVGGFFGARLIGSIDKVFHGNLFSDVQALFSTTRLNGESQGRVNILLAGYQGKASDEGPLTDSIMIVSIDTKNNTAFTMSIPRDLWLKISGRGYQKINAANTNSNFNQAGYFNGGMGQLQQVIEQDMGIPINYYSLIDYNAFEDTVNAVGGITINVQSPDPRGLYDPNVDRAHGGPVRLPNGSVNLNGKQALALALARGDSPYAYGFPQSDINRTQHQRQMLIALEQKALSTGVLSNPLKVTSLFNALGNNVKTNFNLADIIRLASLTDKLKFGNIKSYGLSYAGTHPLLKTYVTYNGQDALIPQAGLNNYTVIQNYYHQLTSAN